MSKIKIHPGFDSRLVEAARRGLWDDPSQCTDIYFSRALAVLKALDINPWVQRQMFCRLKNKKTGVVVGIEEVIAVYAHYTDFFKNGGRMWAVPIGESFSCENGPDTLIIAEGWIQDHMELETIYLGNWSGQMTAYNTGMVTYDLGQVAGTFEAINREMARSPFGLRPLTYFGCRHYPNNLDGKISVEAVRGGAKATATTGSAYFFAQPAVGTIPHSLENVIAWLIGQQHGGDWRRGWDEAVPGAVREFHKVVPHNVRRVTLADYRNHEITDTIASAAALKELGGELFCGRLDTNGANLAEGALESLTCQEADEWRERGIYLPQASHPASKYWVGNGVTVSSCIAMYLRMKEEGWPSASFLTSSMGKPLKFRQFVDAEIFLAQDGVIDSPLFCGAGLGEATEGGLFCTDDVIAVGKDPQHMICLHKTGRPPKPNPKMRRCAGECPTAQPKMGTQLFEEFGY